ncbi:hypothetical protein AB6A68_14540 [Ferrimicrobium acidiphilum]|uniref:Uncharacterized protein n=1 Tax=Ferrimicrobium acidiphilum TaxID=121039 RepID=A0ABV3Y6T6_9ACTN
MAHFSENRWHISARIRNGLDLGPGTLHGTHGRPALEVVADNPPLLPELAGHAGMEVAPEKVKALAPLPEIDHSGLDALMFVKSRE